MDLFEECKNKLGNTYKILDADAEKLVLNKLNAYLLKTGNGSIDWNNDAIMKISLDKLIEKVASQEFTDTVVIITDTSDTPIFSTNLILALENFEDIVALSNTVFLYNENYIGTFTNSSPNIMLGLLKKTIC
ncbi:CDI toxin immunity protein [Faucicola atlantae]|uniref:Uncharacterized protein n=1 Tax=Faucicola atlantae TaxID=34059 RepID=A0A1B8QB32_9GAMM|nr:hypothetical protein [Moraxella atlantae]OBX76550.1 hypothetical protein A9306_09995 [Moraxella atlantae]